jgi:hypothetical protein
MQDNLMDKELNYESLSEYLTQRYPDRETEPDTEFGGFQLFLKELMYRNFKAIGEVHKALERTQKAVDLFEIDFPPEGKKGHKYSAAGIARMSMCLLDSDFTMSNTKLNDISQKVLKKYRMNIIPI